MHIEHASELVPEWFDGYARVGLTAGTSTLPATIEAVHAALLRFAVKGARTRT